MNDHSILPPRSARGRLRAVATAAVISISACSPQPPARTYTFFLEDSIARDGVLARCDRDPAAAQHDIECANARRAALAVQLEEERERRAALERESAAKIEALRREFEARQRALEAAEQESEDDASDDRAHSLDAAAQAGGQPELATSLTSLDAEGGLESGDRVEQAASPHP